MTKLKIILKNLIIKVEGTNGSLKSKLIRGVFWNFISALTSQGFPFIAYIIIARFLGKFGYGELGIINSTIILFSTFAGLGLGTTATKYIAQLYQSDPERTGRIMGLLNLFGLISGILMALLLFLIAPWLSSNVLNSPELSSGLRIASLLLIFNTLIGIQYGSIAGFGSFKSLARIGIIQGLLSFPIMISGVYLFNLIGVISALVINSSINLILYEITIKKLVKEFNIKISYLNLKQELKIIWELSLPTMLSSILVGPVIWIANTIIVNIPNGYAQLGLFNVADQWRNMILVFPSIIGGVLLPMVSANVNKNNKVLEIVNVLASWIIVIIIALPLISFPEIISFLYGQDYASIIFTQSLAIMMFVSCLLAYKEGIARKLVAKNLMWWGFLNNLTWGIIFLLSLVFLKNFGSVGLSVSYLIAYTFVTIVFVPFYISKNVIPKNLLISKEIFLIWAVLIIQTINTLFNTPILIRFLFLLASIAVLVFSFNYIWNKNLKTEQK